MNSRERQMVRESFGALRDVAGPMAVLFYGRLFELEPGLRRMFHGDIGRQGLKLIEMLAAVVEHIDRLEQLNPVLREMGHRHAGYGVETRYYELVEQALLWSIRHALDGELDVEHQQAWRAVIRKVAGAMQEGANGTHGREPTALGPGPMEHDAG